MFDLNEMAQEALRKRVEEVIGDRVDNLEVEVDGTEVTVRGEVQSEEDKDEVLADVQDIEGISKIVTGITVLDEEEEDEEEYDEEESEDVYVVQPGDTLWGIAEKLLGNGALYTQIYEANKDVIGSNPDLIKVGMELVIPE
ncbi:MAG: LysM peptidoglycan-binding domain-containing protein [Thermonemataceae bacterium]|nr:LysM peptidoglycan-binding domain-containing protein [Thermonemataceae bacterium]